MIPPTAQRRALQHEGMPLFAFRPGCVAHLLRLRPGVPGVPACGQRTAKLRLLNSGPRFWATPLCGKCTKIVASTWPEPPAADRLPVDVPTGDLLEMAVALAPTPDVLTSIDLEATIRGVRCWSGESTAPWQKQLAFRRRRLKEASDPKPIVRPRVKRSAELSAIEYVENRAQHRRHYNAIARAIQAKSSAR